MQQSDTGGSPVHGDSQRVLSMALDDGSGEPRRPRRRGRERDDRDVPTALQASAIEGASVITTDSPQLQDPALLTAALGRIAADAEGLPTLDRSELSKGFAASMSVTAGPKVARRQWVIRRRPFSTVQSNPELS